MRNICDVIIRNYRYAIQHLRYDGDYINHFSALINGYKKNRIEEDRIKRVRSLIKSKTTNMSPFRGDTLYIISFLLVEDKLDNEIFIDELLNTFDELTKEGFNECGHLVIASYSITKYSNIYNRNIVYKRMKNIFIMLKEKYGSCTKQDDYVLCALLSLKDIEDSIILENMEVILNHIKKLDIFNNNELQGLTNSILVNDNKDALENIKNLIVELERNDLKIGQQFLQLLGLCEKEWDTDNIINEIKEVLKYLSNEEVEYYYYIDKDFRNMIALIVVFMYNSNKDTKYVDEMLAFGVYSFLMSKNQGILNEVLA